MDDRKKSFWIYFIFIVVIIFIQFLYWYFYQSNVFGFLYSLKNSTHNVLSWKIKNIKLISLNEEKISENKIRWMKSKGINIVIGTNFSSTAEFMRDYLEKYDLVLFSPSITSTALLKDKRIFSMVPSNEFEIREITKFLKENNVKRVLIVLDPFNEVYSKEYESILKTFEGDSTYFYSSKLFDEDLEDFDAIVTTLSPNLMVDFFSMLKDYHGIVLSTDSAVDVSLGALPDYDNFYVVTYNIDEINWSVKMVEDVFLQIVPKHKFITTEQFIKFYTNRRVTDNIIFNSDGFVMRDIKIVKFRFYREEYLRSDKK